LRSTTAIGAVWSTAAPEFGVEAVVDRFSQTAPKLMFVVDGYRYGGKDFVADISPRSSAPSQVSRLSFFSIISTRTRPGSLRRLASYRGTVFLIIRPLMLLHFVSNM
jgi:acetoacetyl-CoA synthetase